MKKFALIAMMVLGTSTVASAAPYRFSASARASASFNVRTRVTPPNQPTYQPARMVTVRDHRTNRTFEVTPCQDAFYNVSGFYDGEAGAVHLTQRGNRVYGTFANGGVMEGVIENGKITYHWAGNGYQGLGFWYVDGHGGLIGTWGANNSDASGGNWNLRLTSR